MEVREKRRKKGTSQRKTLPNGRKGARGRRRKVSGGEEKPCDLEVGKRKVPPGGGTCTAVHHAKGDRVDGSRALTADRTCRNTFTDGALSKPAKTASAGEGASRSASGRFRKNGGVRAKGGRRSEKDSRREDDGRTPKSRRRVGWKERCGYVFARARVERSACLRNAPCARTPTSAHWEVPMVRRTPR